MGTSSELLISPFVELAGCQAGINPALSCRKTSGISGGKSRMAMGIQEGKTPSRDYQRSEDWNRAWCSFKANTERRNPLGEYFFWDLRDARSTGMGQLKNKNSKCSTLGNSCSLQKQKLLQQVLAPRSPDF